MIQINNLQKKFGAKTAVNIDNYIINQGDMLGLVGNNGAGKTTLFRLILDLLQADRGNVTIKDILDEPFNFLDPSSQSIIKQLLKKYNEEHGATVIISSHNLNHTVDVCPRIALLEHGVIIRDIQNENNSAEKELEAYFNVSVEEAVEVENNTDEEISTEE